MHLARAVPAALLAAVLTAPAVPAQDCAPSPTYDASVTSPTVGIPGFPYRRATTLELNRYVQMVDDQSDRVLTKQYATSWGGFPLYYSLVATEENLARVDELAAEQQRLRDPRRTEEVKAMAIADRTPAIVWYSGNVHGNETSGADAAVQILYELAARQDCDVTDMLNELVVGVITTQNPDGRNTFSRQNSYGFDMNRDWFARTQPEIDGQLDLLSKYPPVLFIDAHEQALENFFFPPNDDPIHHEISDESMHWINDLYGFAMQTEFDRRRNNDPLNWDYFNYNTYDLFAMVYGDSVPSTAFTAAGMTFEKGVADPDHIRQLEQFVAGWTSLRTAAANKDEILRQYYEAHQTAIEQGRQGLLEPNEINAPGNELVHQVPNLKIRHYFIGAERGEAEVNHLLDRLMRMGVEVYRLRDESLVGDLQAYGRAPKRGTLPSGTYWIPMAQPQKRWIQAILGEDPYGSLVYFYDTASWSNPLLMNIDAWFSGKALDLPARRVTTAPAGGLEWQGSGSHLWFPGDTARDVALAMALEREDVQIGRVETATDTLPAGAFVVEQDPEIRHTVTVLAERFGVTVRSHSRRVPDTAPVPDQKVAVYAPPGAGESLGHLRYTLDQVWDIPWTAVTGADIAAGRLTLQGFDVLIVPGVSTTDLSTGARQLKAWIEGGGVYVGTARGSSGGTPFAISNGFTSASQSSLSGSVLPGSLFRVEIDAGSPVTLGAPDFAYWFNRGDRKLSLSTTGINPVRYPESEPDFWLSGYAAGHGPLKGSAGLVEEKLGQGRVILFSGEPNFRAYTEGPAFFLANSLIYPPAEESGTDVTSSTAAADVLAAQRSAGPETGPGLPIQVEVPAAQADLAEETVARFGDPRVEVARGSAFLQFPNPRDLEPDQHPFAARLIPALDAAGVDVLSAVL
ncbi:MAG TPA: M14 family zinc carboxypeptidase [Actinomycetota bacterium]|nr:M14 family zinc carboxypeptidase [Actinomycetota bacterium]